MDLVLSPNLRPNELQNAILAGCLNRTRCSPLFPTVLNRDYSTLYYFFILIFILIIILTVIIIVVILLLIIISMTIPF